MEVNRFLQSVYELAGRMIRGGGGAVILPETEIEKLEPEMIDKPESKPRDFMPRRRPLEIPYERPIPINNLNIVRPPNPTMSREDVLIQTQTAGLRDFMNKVEDIASVSNNRARGNILYLTARQMERRRPTPEQKKTIKGLKKQSGLLLENIGQNVNIYKGIPRKIVKESDDKKI